MFLLHINSGSNLTKAKDIHYSLIASTETKKTQISMIAMMPRCSISTTDKFPRFALKGSMDGDLKICDIGNVFDYDWRTSKDTTK